MAEQTNVSFTLSDDDIRRRRLSSFIINALLLGVIIVVGIIGNCLTFVVFGKGNFKSSTSFLFMSLSLIDSAYLITAFPIYSVRAFVAYTGWQKCFSSVRPFLIVYGDFIVTTTKTATIWVAVLVAVNRYIIVCRPLMVSRWCTTSKVNIQLAVVLVLSVVCHIPELLKCRIKYYAVNNGTSYATGVYCIHFQFKIWRSFYNVYDLVVAHVLWTGVPLCILTLLTIRLIAAMKAHRRRQLEMNRPSLHNQPDSNMTFALIMVVIVFIICHVPTIILSIVWYVIPMGGVVLQRCLVHCE